MTGKRTLMAMLWCGPIAIAIFMVAIMIAGWMPPPSPNDSAAEVKAMYADDADMIRAGLVLMMVAGTLTGPFVAAISTVIKRIEGVDHPLSSAQLGLGMIGILLFLIPTMLMQAAAFRPDRDAELISLIHDAGWLPFVGAFAPAVIQNIVIAVAAFKDTEERYLPRWLGYFNVWVALLFLPAALLYYFKTGPFAWDGVFVFWLPLSVFGAWFFVMFFVFRKAILNAPDETAAVAEPPARTPIAA
ncbi:MAG TPA: hypothetical protein VFZ89_13615 [Solirubrobacteraceae bacterium]